MLTDKGKRRQDRGDGMKITIYRRIEEQPLLKWWESLIAIVIIIGLIMWIVPKG